MVTTRVRLEISTPGARADLGALRISKQTGRVARREGWLFISPASRLPIKP